MAEPTLKDVLAAIAKLTMRVDATESNLRGEIKAVRVELGAKLDALDAKVDTFRDVLASTRQDTEAVTADIVTLHKGLVRAKVPGIPKDLPSHVRAKGERPSKPAKRIARRR